MQNYRTVKVSELEFGGIRDIRPGVVEHIKNRIRQDGFNDARPLVVKNTTVVDGNHRLKALQELGYEGEVPVVETEDDIYSESLRCNRDEDTYASMDLFDYLDIVETLTQEEGLTQKEAAKKMGWSRSKLQDYVRILNRIDANILDLARQYQEGRASPNDANATFDFTEGWFRNSGLYDLNGKYQEEVMREFLDSGADWSKQKLKKETKKRKKWMKWLDIAEEELRREEDLAAIKEKIENGDIRNRNHLDRNIESFNQEVWEQENIQYSFTDALDYVDNLEEPVDCVVTDPPYGIEFTSPRYRNKDFETLEGDENTAVFKKFLKKLPSVMKPDSHAYIFTRWNKYPELLPHVPEELEVANLLIWNKGNGGHGMGDLEKYAPQHEMILFLRKGERLLERPRPTDVLTFRDIRFTDEEKHHPTQKPVDLLKFLIEKSTVEGETVLDPFMGSGSTAVAAASLNRGFYGCEIDESYKEIVDGRVNDVL